MVEKPVGRRGRPRQREEDIRHLEFHGGTYRVVLTVPRRVRHIVGSSRFREDLGTADLAIAAMAKRGPIDRFQAKIDAALAEIGETKTARELAALQAILFDHRLHPDRYTASEIELVESHLRDLDPVASEIERERIRDVLDGVGLPLAPAEIETALAPLHDEYMAEHAGRLAPSTLAGNKEAIRWLLGWLAEQRVAPSIEAMTERRIEDFARTLPDMARISTTSTAQLLSRMSAFWRWAGDRGLVTMNPWTKLAADVRAMPRSDS